GTGVDAAAAPLELAGGHVEQGGRPRPVRPDDRPPLPGSDVEIHAGQGVDPAEVAPQRADIDHARASRRTAPTMPSRAKTTKTMNTIPSTVWAGSAEGSTRSMRSTTAAPRIGAGRVPAPP